MKVIDVDEKKSSVLVIKNKYKTFNFKVWYTQRSTKLSCKIVRRKKQANILKFYNCGHLMEKKASVSDMGRKNILKSLYD